MDYHNAGYNFQLMNMLKYPCLTFLDFNSQEYAKPGDSQFKVSMIIFCGNLNLCILKQPLLQFHSIITVFSLFFLYQSLISLFI